jgi:hypothetical protein
MPVLGANLPTLLDITRAQDPDGKIAAVAEILTETNEMLMDMPFFEGNLATGHRTTIRTGIPTPTWRAFYQGVQPTKSTRAQVTDSTGMLEDYAEVDKALADLNGNSAAYRASEDYAHLEGMSQAAQQAIIYGNSALNPTQIQGFAQRYNSLSALNGENILSGASAGADNGSIWLVVWGPNTAHGIYPKGLDSAGGLTMRDLGEVTVENIDGANGRMQAYRTHYKWSMGLCVRDWRYVVRIANLRRSTTLADPISGAVLPNLMFEAIERIPSLSAGTPVFYMDRFFRTRLRQQIPNVVKNSTLGVENVGGMMTYKFQEIPVRRIDKLSPNEALVT